MYTKEQRHEYYLKNKEKIKEINKRWCDKNKEKNYKSIYNSRKKRAEKLKKEGLMYCWYSNKKRQEIYERINRRIKENEDVINDKQQ